MDILLFTFSHEGILGLDRVSLFLATFYYMLWHCLLME